MSASDSQEKYFGFQCSHIRTPRRKTIPENPKSSYLAVHLTLAANPNHVAAAGSSKDNRCRPIQGLHHRLCPPPNVTPAAVKWDRHPAFQPFPSRFYWPGSCCCPAVTEKNLTPQYEARACLFMKNQILFLEETERHSRHHRT